MTALTQAIAALKALDDAAPDQVTLSALGKPTFDNLRTVARAKLSDLIEATADDPPAQEKLENLQRDLVAAAGMVSMHMEENYGTDTQQRLIAWRDYWKDLNLQIARTRRFLKDLPGSARAHGAARVPRGITVRVDDNVEPPSQDAPGAA